MFITTRAVPKIPLPLLQRAEKLTITPPEGVVPNVRRLERLVEPPERGVHVREVELGLGELGVGLLGLAVRDQGVAPAAEAAERVADVVLDPRLVLVLDVQRRAVDAQRVRRPPELLVRASEVEVRVGVVGQQPHRLLEAAHRLLAALRRAQQHAELAVPEAVRRL